MSSRQRYQPLVYSFLDRSVRKHNKHNEAQPVFSPVLIVHIVKKETSMVKLQIFITDDCWSCEESRRIAVEIQTLFDDVDVVLVDLNSDERPDSVFAAPTYVLDGRVISLGNPHREVLWEQLAGQIDNGRNDGGEG